MDWLSIGVLLGGVAAAAATVGFYVWTGVPALPTSPRVLGPMLVLMDRSPRRRMADLGSGYGTVVLEAARRWPRTQVVGFEVSAVPFLIATARAWWSRLPNLSIHYADFFGEDLSGFDLLTCYLTRKPMRRLEEKLDRELAEGGELVCHTFALPKWQPRETLEASDLYRTRVYRYVKPSPPRPPARHPWLEKPARDRDEKSPRKLLSD